MPKDFSLPNLLRDLDYTVNGTYVHEFLFRVCPPRPGLKVLEVGAGSGKFGLSYALHGVHVTLIEIDREVVEYSRRIRVALEALSGSALPVEVIAGDLFRWLPKLGGYDLVFNEGVCIPPGTLIMTKTGPRAVEMVKENDQVLTHRGKFQPVMQTFTRPFTGVLIRLTTACSPVPTLCTPEHPILLTSGNGLRWKQAQEIQVGDELAFPILKPAYLSHLRVSFPHRKNRGWFHPTVSLAKLMGFYLAEGSISGSRTKERPNRVDLNFGRGDKEIQLCREAIQAAKYLRLNSTLREKRNGCHVVTIHSMALAYLFQGLLGKGADGKFIHPQVITGFNSRALTALWESYWKGDGYTQKSQRTLRACTISLPLVLSLRDLCLRLGYAFAFTLDRYKGERRFSRHQLFNIHVNEHSHGTNQGRGWFKNGYFVRRVKAVLAIPYSGMVHNLLVREDNSYCLPYESVHNCQHWPDEERRQGCINLMAEVSRGMVVIIGNNGLNPKEQEVDRIFKFTYEGMPPARKCFTPDELKERLGLAGLREVKVEPLGGIFMDATLIAGWGRKK